jgi:hypothetical protein
MPASPDIALVAIFDGGVGAGRHKSVMQGDRASGYVLPYVGILGGNAKIESYLESICTRPSAPEVEDSPNTRLDKSLDRVYNGPHPVVATEHLGRVFKSRIPEQVIGNCAMHNLRIALFTASGASSSKWLEIEEHIREFALQRAAVRERVTKL